MKKLFLNLSLCLSLVVIGSQNIAHADIFNPIGVHQDDVFSDTVSARSATVGVDSGTILAEVTQIASYLGTREGYFYDINQHEFVNYAAATIITYDPYGLSASFGALNADGIGASIDWNAGKYIPTANVPLLNFTQYFYIGFGIGERYISDNNGVDKWRFAYGPTGEFKFTF